MSTGRKGSSACTICRKRKVKCDMSIVGRPCTNCHEWKYVCLPHQRKRRRYTLDDDHTSRPVLASTCQPTDQITSTNDRPPHATRDSEHSVVREYEPISNTIENDHYSTPTMLQDASATECSYVGRSAYLGGQMRFTEDLARSNAGLRSNDPLSDASLHLLHSQHAFDLPSRAVRASLVASFMKHIHPWMPVVEQSWLVGHSDAPSWLLLQQATFLAASRVSHSHSAYTSSHEFYTRARSLFFHASPGNSLLSIIAALLLQWWHPNGPETVSMDSSAFWSRIGIELAYQMGLHVEPKDQTNEGFRRRLWWSLVARDNILSVGLGRPRAIDSKEYTVEPPSNSDFQISDAKSQLFVAHVAISRCMGSIAEAHRRRCLTDDKRRGFENDLYRWVHQLPHSLRIFVDRPDKALADHDLMNLQLHVSYFACLLILYKDSTPNSSQSTAALIAASFIIGIMEDIMARNEVQYLPAIFPFYALAAGLVGLSGCRFATLRSTTEQDLAVVRMVLEQLSQRWKSAESALIALRNASEVMRKQPDFDYEPAPLSKEVSGFFDTFGPELCRFYNIQFVRASSRLATVCETTLLDPTFNRPRDQWQLHDMTIDEPEYRELNQVSLEQTLSLPEDHLPPIGSWLFDDLFFNDQIGI